MTKLSIGQIVSIQGRYGICSGTITNCLLCADGTFRYEVTFPDNDKVWYSYAELSV